MIFTVCPNPCVDCTIEVENLDVGKLARIDNKIENCAGKACNAAIGIARLGEKVFVSGFMFEGGGKSFCEYLDHEGVPYEFVWNKGLLRVNYKIIDGKSMLTELNDSGAPVAESKQKELLSLISKRAEQADITIISGSLPKDVPSDYYYHLVKSAHGKVIVDCEKDNLRAALRAGVYMVKPNINELESFNKEVYGTMTDIVDGCRKMLKSGAEKVMLSLGREGAILTDGANAYYCRSENVAVNSTVGAGDSMVAAASVCFEKGMPDDEVLRHAVAAGTASVTTQGTRLFTKDKYEEILQNLVVTKM